MAHARAISFNDPARPPLADIKQGLKMRDRFLLGGRRYHFFDSRSLAAPAVGLGLHSSVSYRPATELRVLRFQRAKPLRLRHSVPARQISHLLARLCLTQNTDNLLFCKSYQLP